MGAAAHDISKTQADLFLYCTRRAEGINLVCVEESVSRFLYQGMCQLQCEQTNTMDTFCAVERGITGPA